MRGGAPPASGSWRMRSEEGLAAAWGLETCMALQTQKRSSFNACIACTDQRENWSAQRVKGEYTMMLGQLLLLLSLAAAAAVAAAAARP